METTEQWRPVVLIVEDDPLLRMLAVEIVEEAGFAPLEACNADEAVTLLEARTDIVLLFTDVQMPGSMDGIRLAHAVRNRWPPVKIIVASGQVCLELADLPFGSHVIAKPYAAEAMIAELQSLVGPRAPSNRILSA